MEELRIAFLFIVLIITCVQGIGEGLHIGLMNRAKMGSNPDHMRKWVMAILFMVTCFAMLILPYQVAGLDFSMAFFITALLAAGSIRWFFRDGCQNLVLEENWFYNGQVAQWDKWLGSPRLHVMAFRKVVAIVVFVTLFLFFEFFSKMFHQITGL